MRYSDNDLPDLGHRLADAVDSVNQAIRHAEYLMGTDPEQPGDPGWQAMSALVDKLTAIRGLLAELPGDEITKAIADQHACLDDMADRADGISY